MRRLLEAAAEHLRCDLEDLRNIRIVYSPKWNPPGCSDHEYALLLKKEGPL